MVTGRFQRGCLIPINKPERDGYVKVKHNGERGMAHRIMYKIFRGPIPSDRVLDHLCRNRSCMNPDHLEAVTQRENILRGRGIAARLAKKNNCKRGHRLGGDNLYITPRGHRQCKKCGALKMRRLRRKWKVGTRWGLDDAK